MVKKLAFDSSNWKLIGTINDLIDRSNDHTKRLEAIEKRLDDISKRLPYVEFNVLKEVIEITEKASRDNE